jgi:hypothetical protein
VDFRISGDKASYLSNVVSSLPNISLVLILFFMWQQQLALWDTRIPRGTVKVRLSILSIGDVVTTCNNTLLILDTGIPRGTVKVRLSILSIGDVVTTCNNTLHLN